jgi:hypothetical protein
MHSASGLPWREKAIVADYEGHPSAVVGAMSKRYRPLACEEFFSLCEAATLAGAKPTGAFALYGGSVIVATFEVGTSNGLRTQFLLVDSFDGSHKVTAGHTSIRVVCANTLSFAMSKDGDNMAALRHTASLERRVKLLGTAIEAAIRGGDSARKLYETAERATFVDTAAFDRAFDALFPPAPEDASQNAKTRAENARIEARAAGRMAINRVGSTKANLATLWNAATFLVDREVVAGSDTGVARPLRGGANPLESLISDKKGTRGARVQVIQNLIETVLVDGSVRLMTVDEATSHGIDHGQIAKSILRDVGLDV